VQNALMSKLEERPWRTDILKVDGQQVYVSGGARQGIRVGDTLAILQAGEKVKSAQTGFEISLPSKSVGQLRITAIFGDNETNEGAVGEIVSGVITDAQRSNLYVGER